MLTVKVEEIIAATERIHPISYKVYG